MKEVWKLFKVAKMKSFNKFYQYYKGDKLYVSNYGRCKVNDKIVEPYIHRDGYYWFGGEYLHRIVYELFVGPIPEGYEIDHIYTDRTDNRIEYLRVVTRKENRNNPLTRKHYSDAKQGNKHSEETKRKISESHKKKPVLQLTKEEIFVKEYESAMQAERETKIHHGSIIKCCQGKLKSAGCFVWKYKE